jgi:hypothetical protein
MSRLSALHQPPFKTVVVVWLMCLGVEMRIVARRQDAPRGQGSAKDSMDLGRQVRVMDPHKRGAGARLAARFLLLSNIELWDGGRESGGVGWQPAKLKEMEEDQWPCMTAEGMGSASAWHLCARLFLWLAQQQQGEGRGGDGVECRLTSAHRMFLTALRLDSSLFRAHQDLAVMLLQLELKERPQAPSSYSSSSSSPRQASHKLRAVYHAHKASLLEEHAAAGGAVGLQNEAWLVLATALDESFLPRATLLALRRYLQARCKGDSIECRGAYIRTAVSELWRLCQAQAACWQSYDADVHRLRLLVANEVRSCMDGSGRATEAMAQRYSPWFFTVAPLPPPQTLAGVKCLAAAARHAALLPSATPSPHPPPLPLYKSRTTGIEAGGGGGVVSGAGGGGEWAGWGGAGAGEETRLVLGYVSSHFTKTMLNGLFNDVLSSHDNTRFRIVCFAWHAVDENRGPGDQDQASRQISGTNVLQKLKLVVLKYYKRPGLPCPPPRGPAARAAGRAQRDSAAVGSYSQRPRHTRADRPPRQPPHRFTGVCVCCTGACGRHAGVCWRMLAFADVLLTYADASPRSCVRARCWRLSQLHWSSTRRAFTARRARCI